MKKINRRDFLSSGATLVAGASVFPFYSLAGDKTNASGVKKRVAMVGTGNRGARTWGVPVVKDFSNYVEFVGLCDINHKRTEVAKK